MDINGAKLMTDKFIRAMNRANNPEDKLHKTFLKMVTLLGTEPFFEDESSSRRSARLLSQEDLYNADRIISLIKRSVPIAYQQIINQRRLELIRGVEDTEVPEMPNEPLQSTLRNDPLKRTSSKVPRGSVDSGGSFQDLPPADLSRKSDLLVASPFMAKGKQRASIGSGISESQEETPVPTIFSPFISTSIHTDTTTPGPAYTTIAEEYADGDHGLRSSPFKPTQPKGAAKSSEECRGLDRRSLSSSLILPQS